MTMAPPSSATMVVGWWCGAGGGVAVGSGMPLLAALLLPMGRAGVEVEYLRRLRPNDDKRCINVGGAVRCCSLFVVWWAVVVAVAVGVMMVVCGSPFGSRKRFLVAALLLDSCVQGKGVRACDEG
jgi:hypothetical protein